MTRAVSLATSTKIVFYFLQLSNGFQSWQLLHVTSDVLDFDWSSQKEPIEKLQVKQVVKKMSKSNQRLCRVSTIWLLKDAKNATDTSI